MKDAGAGANVKGQHAGCLASGQPLTEVTRKTLLVVSGHLRRSLPPGEGIMETIRFWFFCCAVRSDLGLCLWFEWAMAG